MLSLRQQALLALLKPNSEFDFSVLSPGDWQSVKLESTAQAVTILAFDGTQKCKKYIPNDIYSDWFNSSMMYLLNNNSVAKSQENLVEIMLKNNLSYIILKGLASAHYYPDPQKRILGDVDFLIDKTQQTSVESALMSSGYKKELDDHICHRVFKKNNERLEMHFEVAGIPNGEVGILFRHYLKDAVCQFENTQTNFNNPISKIHAAIILLHSIHHLLGEGLGIRHLCDWAYFVDKTYNDSFWERDFLPLLKQTGTLNFAAIFTKTAHLYLGTVCPEWARDIDETICEDLIKDFFESGNLGKKDLNRAGSAQMISQHGKSGTSDSKLKNQFLTLKNSMYYNYPFLHKWKILYPLVFIWRIIRYLWLMILGKRPSLIKANAFANQRLSLYKQFKLYETKEK